MPKANHIFSNILINKAGLQPVSRYFEEVSLFLGVGGFKFPLVPSLHRQKDRQTDRQTYRQTEKQADRQTERQAEGTYFAAKKHFVKRNKYFQKRFALKK